MIVDQQVRRLFRLMQSDKSLAVAASKAGMEVKAVRKYLKAWQFYGQMRPVRIWRKREEPFLRETCGQDSIKQL
jgi:molybdenum-dependent DNA-binding transcriptional regulator ModE